MLKDRDQPSQSVSKNITIHNQPSTNHLPPIALAVTGKYCRPAQPRVSLASDPQFALRVPLFADERQRHLTRGGPQLHVQSALQMGGTGRLARRLAALVAAAEAARLAAGTLAIARAVVRHGPGAAYARTQVVVRTLLLRERCTDGRGRVLLG